jgi:hypothetical protein
MKTVVYDRVVHAISDWVASRGTAAHPGPARSTSATEMLLDVARREGCTFEECRSIYSQEMKAGVKQVCWAILSLARIAGAGASLWAGQESW